MLVHVSQVSVSSSSSSASSVPALDVDGIQQQITSNGDAVSGLFDGVFEPVINLFENSGIGSVAGFLSDALSWIPLGVWLVFGLMVGLGVFAYVLRGLK